MTQEEALLEIEKIFRTTLKKENITLTESSTSNDIEGWDSLSHMIIISSIEKQFGVRFNFREVIKFKNIGDLCTAILTKKQ